MAKAKNEVAKIKVTLVKSTIAVLPLHKKVVESLGLKKIGSSKVHNANPSILGMVEKVKYLLKVENV
ncbi:MAG: 50S ribosomal protein L30 [Clostridia bacterium]|nr:50S ribosomal protein L30 [Clostridia bacterium]